MGTMIPKQLGKRLEREKSNLSLSMSEVFQELICAKTEGGDLRSRELCDDLQCEQCLFYLDADNKAEFEQWFLEFYNLKEGS